MKSLKHYIAWYKKLRKQGYGVFTCLSAAAYNCKHYGIDGKRDDANTGVWVGKQKVAAVGISSSRWITTHGFALNVDPDLTQIQLRVPG